MFRNFYDFEDFDLTEEVASANYQPIKKNMISHNLKVIGGLALVFFIGGLQALKGLTWTNGIETIIPILLVIEHALDGNTGQ